MHGDTSGLAAHGVGSGWLNQTLADGGWDSEKLDGVFVDSAFPVSLPYKIVTESPAPPASESPSTNL